MKMCQNKYVGNTDVLKEPIMPRGSTIAMQCEDGGPWYNTVALRTKKTIANQTE